MNRQASVTPSFQDVPHAQHGNSNGNDVPVALRRIILRILSKKYGLQLHSSAISFIHTTLESHGLLEDESEWTEAIEWLAKGLIESAGKGEQGEDHSNPSLQCK